MLQVCVAGRYRIAIDVTSPGAGSVADSNLCDETELAVLDPTDLDEAVDAALFKGAVNALESFILALACDGVDITTPGFSTALITAMQTCEKYLE